MTGSATVHWRMTTGAFVVATLAFGVAHAQARKPRASAKKTTSAATKPTTARTRTAGARTRTAGARTKPTGASAVAQASKSLVVLSEPNATVWVDGVRRGTTDGTGKIELKDVARAGHAVRVRAKGFAEGAVTVSAAQVARGRVSVPLSNTLTDAERAFQEAEELHEKGTEESRRAALELYRHAVELRPSYPAAHVAFARALAEVGRFDDALEEVENARYGPVNAEASAVEGRIHHSAGDDAAALQSYRRAIREARGFQPEAHTGVGIILQEKGDYAGAAAEFTKAVAQLSDTEPVIYQLLGEAYEKQEKYKEAVAAYENYLRLAPTGKLAPAIESIIEQLRKQAAEQDAPPPNI